MQMILVYVIIFFIIGYLITKLLKENKKIFLAILGVAIFWGVYYHPMWGLVSFGEMAFGYFFVKFNED